MPALPADIVRATRQARIVTHEDASVKAAFADARDGASDPDPGYFENAADAAAALELKAAMIGRYARRLAVTGAGDLAFDPAIALPVPTVIDAALGVNGTGLLSRVEIDLEAETFALEVYI